MTKTTINYNRYDVTVQWTDETREPGYQERIETMIVEAGDTPDSAIAVARTLRPNASRVQVHGVAGTGIAFDGRANVWTR